RDRAGPRSAARARVPGDERTSQDRHRERRRSPDLAGAKRATQDARGAGRRHGADPRGGERRRARGDDSLALPARRLRSAPHRRPRRRASRARDHDQPSQSRKHVWYDRRLATEREPQRGTGSHADAARESPLMDPTSQSTAPPTPAAAQITRITFKPAGKLYEFDPGALRLMAGDLVVVETERGGALGTVADPKASSAAAPGTRAPKVLR